MKKYIWNTHKIVQETLDTITICFDTAQQSITYLPGQYLNLKCVIDGQLVIRSYSFSSAPSDEFPSITVKRVAGGKMSNFILDNAADIKTWEVDAPFGSFVLEGQLAEQSQVVLMAGGSGISPLFAMLKSMDNAVNAPLLIYGNRSPEETIFYNVIDTMQAERKVNIYYSFTSSDFISSKLSDIAGRFSTLVLRSIIRTQVKVLEEAHFYICGPAGLMDLYQSVLLAMNIPEEHIHMEYFNAAIDENPSFEHDGLSRDVIVNYYEDSYVNDEKQTYECTSMIEVRAGQSLLDALKDHQISVSSSCLNGTCGACWAVRTDGEVRMIRNHALTQQDIAQGIVLLCQSYPVNQDVCLLIQ